MTLQNAVELLSGVQYIWQHNSEKILSMKIKLLLKYVQSIQLFFFKSSGLFKKRNSPFDISQRLQQVSKIILCFPENPAEVEAATAAARRLKEIFLHWDITIFAAHDRTPSIEDTADFAVVTYSATNLSRFNKPKKELWQALNGSYDLAMDLSIPFHFLNTVVVWTLGEKLRIGFYHPEREHLYNFMLRRNVNTTLESSYQSLVNYLQSFK